ncbi:unnamed protein product [Rotaria socialis]|uniref:Phosphatidate phosphatase APP1 catalytic domain-containing protein n=1 Tax=Rotaria socialis TaxID=392032 RepID=A0A820S4T0_9BILA|nr:unnamed protein product [Rotaria socialis]CAF3387950.1 unnamed protein product [Rotaria socialis]CAF3488911.1 unnamed protein product [Rotaria socialis]CAF3739825.1 unnamed protein product [Rotaria socialis]CAF4320905.1 unnamed protein product [Rotaria socialis]
MTSYLKKSVVALASARTYIAQWSAEHVYADEALIIPFPTLAKFNPDKGVWSVQIKAWLYLPIEGNKLKIFFSSLPGRLMRKIESTKREDSVDKELNLNVAGDLEENNEQVEIIDDDDDPGACLNEDAVHEDSSKVDENPGRLGYFFVRKSVKVITKSIINDVEHLLQPSDESGFIEGNLELSDEEIRSLGEKIHPDSSDLKFDYTIQINQSNSDIRTEPCKLFKCTIYALAHNGLSIISDIDDTIKISEVVSTRELLKHTFVSDFKPVDGMSELYQAWSEQNCQFHYVSSSPWQLFPALSVFLKKYKYPMGTINLRKFAWGFKHLKPPKTYKMETITQILNAYPSRQYIFVGDSGELDPEIYSKLYTMFPQNIRRIFIRDVCKTPECLPQCQERYLSAFQDVPKEQWTIFKDPRKVETDIRKITAV